MSAAAVVVVALPLKSKTENRRFCSPLFLFCFCAVVPFFDSPTLRTKKEARSFSHLASYVHTILRSSARFSAAYVPKRCTKVFTGAASHPSRRHGGAAEFQCASISFSRGKKFTSRKQIPIHEEPKDRGKYKSNKRYPGDGSYLESSRCRACIMPLSLRHPPPRPPPHSL